MNYLSKQDYNSNPEIIMSKEYDPTVGKGNNLSRQIAVGESPIGLSRDAVEDYLCATTGKPISMCGCEGPLSSYYINRRTKESRSAFTTNSTDSRSW